MGKLVPNVCGSSADTIAEDGDGNIYLGSGPNTALTKFDSAGNLLWSWGRQETDCAAHIWVRSVSIDESNNIYVSGGVWGNVIIGDFRFPSPLNFPAQAEFIAKMMPDRTIAFAKFAYNLYWEKPYLNARAGEFLLGGSVSDYNALRYEGITLTGSAGSDIAVVKVNPDGSPAWARRASGTGDDQLGGMTSSPEGDIFVAGTTLASSSFGMGGVIGAVPTSNTLLLVKMDSAGNGKWIKSVGSSFNPTVSEPVGFSAAAYSTGAGAVIWAGDFAGSLKLTSPAIPSMGGKDVFVAKLSTAGTTAWAKSFGGTNDQYANVLAVDAAGNIYVAGFFFGQITIGQTTLTSRGQQDIFIAKLQDDGTPLWAKQIGYSGGDSPAALYLTKRGELLISGTIEGGLLIDDFYLEGSGQTDGFIAKFKLEGLPPSFTLQPQSKVVSAGMTTTLLCEASSTTQPVLYQWWFNGAPIVGQTNSSLTLSNVQPNQGGSYFVVARNQIDTKQSDVAILSYTDASTLVLSVHPSLQIFGTTGRTYRIEYATETKTPVQWNAITNVTLNTTPLLWLDQEAAVGAKRFYRVTLQPMP